MSLLSQFAPFTPGGATKLRSQEFTSSGTFTPSATLLANGGVVFVFLVGAGAGFSSDTPGCGGAVIQKPFTCTGPTTVTIAAAVSPSGGAGGTSSFGSMVAPGGVAPPYRDRGVAQIGAGSSNPIIGGTGQLAVFGTSGFGSGGSNQAAIGVALNSGMGGCSSSTPSGAGYCIVFWME
jgi:hypothetical protein